MTVPLSISMPRRHVLAVLGAAALSGCAHDSTYDLIKSSFFGSPGDAGAYPMTADQIAELPYATLGVRVGKNPAAVMVLVEQRQDQLVWVSTNRVVFVTQGARLVQTVGLGRDLSGLTAVGVDPLLNGRLAEAAEVPHALTRTIDMRDPDEFSVPVLADLETVGPETIQIMGKSRATIHLRERLRVERWNWRSSSDFWVDAKTGRLWRSRSQYCPDIAPIMLEVLKPAA